MPASRRPAWILLSLRARGEHDALRRAAARYGGGLIALSPWRLQPRRDPASAQGLAHALHAPVVVFTSPAAVRAAAALQKLVPRRRQAWLAVGAGTAAALRRAGIDDVLAPTRMDSEGLLALPALAGATDVGLVTAPGGRGLLADTLATRGARIARADVYARVALPLPASAIARLLALDVPACVALSSGQALELVLAGLPAAAREVLLRAGVAAASPRLAAMARAQGWAPEQVVLAASPRPAALAGAAHGLAAHALAMQALATRI